MSNQNVQILKSKINIVDLISSYLELKKSGSNYKGVCPFHNEKSPSFMVNENLQIYKCFGCNESGDIFSFIQKLEGLDFAQSINFLSEKYNIPIEKNVSTNSLQEIQKKRIYSINNYTQEYYSYILTQHKLGQHALEYLMKKRKLSMEMIKEFKLGYAPTGWDNLTKFLLSKGFTENDLIAANVVQPKKTKGVYDKFRSRIIFPYFSLDEKCIGFMGRTLGKDDPKYLNSSDTPVFKKGEFLYGLYKTKLLIKKEGAILVEGTMDFLKPYQFGFKNIIATSGTALTREQLELIKRYTNKLYFCFDSDNAGVNAILRGVEIADRFDFDLKVIKIKPPYKDLDEFFDAEGNVITSLIENSIDINDFFMNYLFQKHNKKTSSGKNHIISEFKNYYQKIKNEITKSHYLKKLSENLDLNEEVILKIFKTGSKLTYQDKPTTTPQNPVQKYQITDKVSKESAFLAILLNSPIDILKPIMLKSKVKYFKNQSYKDLFQALENYLQDGELMKFDISSFTRDLDDDLRELVENLVLIDLKIDLNQEDQIREELESLSLFLRKESIKEEIKELNHLLKDAERENNLEKVSTLISEINNLSKLL
jgi:DNA primase